MLVDTQYLPNTKKLVVSYVDSTGDIKLKYYNWERPLGYEECEPDDPNRDMNYRSWRGDAVKRVELSYPDRYSIYEFLDSLPQSERDEIFDFHFPKIYFIDIETEIVDGFPEAVDIKDDFGKVIKEGASTQVLSISIVYDDKIILMGLKDMPMEMQNRIEKNTNDYFGELRYKLKYVKYPDEFTMLNDFFVRMVPKMPLLTGWNFIQYDWQYLINRARKISKFIDGVERFIDVRVSSWTKRISKIWGTNYEVPAHRMIFDYMQLYEALDTSVKVKESSSLDFVSRELVGVEKIKYVGSLQKLYEEDFETFMYYNAVDSVLVQKIHENKNYISIIFAVSSLAKIKVVDVFSQMNNALASLAITEGVLRDRFRKMDGVVLFKSKGSGGGESALSGGWVKDPKVGMNKWVSIYDFASLYPTTQAQFYIAPETYLGTLDAGGEWILNGNKRRKLDVNNHVVCNNGCVFEKRESPTLNMLREVYLDRKKNKKIMMSRKEELKSVLDEIKKLQESI